jgi:hypothetical protein
MRNLVFANENVFYSESEWYGNTKYGYEKSDITILTKQMNDKASVRGIYSAGKSMVESL